MLIRTFLCRASIDRLDPNRVDVQFHRSTPRLTSVMPKGSALLPMMSLLPSPPSATLTPPPPILRDATGRGHDLYITKQPAGWQVGTCCPVSGERRLLVGVGGEPV